MPLVWTLQSGPPEGWAESLRAVGGGFFQSPAVVETLGGRGSPAYATGFAHGRAVAAGVCLWQRCRLSAFPRHVRLLSLPAVSGTAHEVGASTLASLLLELGKQGAAQVVIDSFDAVYSVEPGKRVVPGAERTEFRIGVGQSEEKMLGAMASAHRRKVRGGEGNGWALETLEGASASEALTLVQASAARRRLDLERPTFEPAEGVETEGDGPGRRWPTWGTRTFAAVEGREVLSAALVGWGGDRAFYVSGGSTPLGYKKSAAFWMHWQIMLELGRAGLTTYNLGGVPAGAASPGNDQHGLYRFKHGFGGEVVHCRGGIATLGAGHARLHAAAGRVARALRRLRTRRSPTGHDGGSGARTRPLTAGGRTE